MKINKKRIDNVTLQMSVNSILGASIGFGLMICLSFFPEKNMKADPVTSAAVMALSFSSLAGAIVSGVTLKREFDRND